MKRKVYTAMQLAGKGMHVVISNGTIENPIATAISGFGTHVSPA